MNKKSSSTTSPVHRGVWSLFHFNMGFKITLGFVLRYMITLILLSSLFISLLYLFTTRVTHQKLSHQLTQITTHYNSLSASNFPLMLQSGQTLMIQEQSDDPKVIPHTVTYHTALPDSLSVRPLFTILPLKGLQETHSTATHLFVLVEDITICQDVINHMILLGGLSITFLVIYLLLSGSHMTHRFLSPIQDMNQNIQQLITSGATAKLDVTHLNDELKELGTSFNALLSEINAGNHREKEFVSNASHELRTPVSVIKGYANMMDRWAKSDPDILQESINAIKAESITMERLLDGLLMISRGERGQIEYQPEVVDVSQLIHDIYKDCEFLSDHHTFTETIEDQVFVRSQPALIQQIIRIFIDNAIQYTPPSGSIHIELRNGETHATISVFDTGVGISKEQQQRIFDRFYRVDESRTRTKGSGLGLSIAKMLATLCGATITIKSELSQGSEFTLLIPH